MSKLHLAARALLLLTTPSLLAQPLPHIQTSSTRKLPKSFRKKERYHLVTYNEVLTLLHEIETEEAFTKYRDKDLKRIANYLAHLAKKGALPNTPKYAALEADIDDLLNPSDYAFASAAAPDYTIHSPTDHASYEYTLCKHSSKSGWHKTKKFVKKYKKEIIIGIIIIVTIIIVAITMANREDPALEAPDDLDIIPPSPTPSAPDLSETAPILNSLLEEQAEFFKTTVAHGQYFEPTEFEGLPWEETGKVLGGLFAIETLHQLEIQRSTDPLLAHEIGDIDFSPNLTRALPTCTPTYEPDVATQSYQALGERALQLGYYETATDNFTRALDYNPQDPTPYLQRSSAYFQQGDYDRSIEDFHKFTIQVEQSPEKIPFSTPEFTLGFAKGLPQGILESGNNILLLCSDVILHPIQTGEQIWGSFKLLSDLARSNEWSIFAEVLAPEAHQLITQWDALPSDERGKLAGHAFGKYGADIIIPGALAKAAAKGMRGAQELSAISSSFKTAKRTFLVESAAGIGSGEKIAEIVQIEKRISKWLGEGARFIGNEAGDPVFLSKDGLRCVRFDFNRTKPHHNPHAHVEVKVDGKWVKSGQIYPIDVPHN